jgi:cobaltochelatase CobN
VLRFVTTADTEILATASAVERLPDEFPEVRCVNPAGAPAGVLIDDLLDGARVVLCRILGGRRGWPEGFDLLRARCDEQGIALLALGGEAEPDAEMTGLSLAPAGAVAQAGEYLRHGDVDNVEQLLRFLADTFLLEGHGFEPPHEVADLGVYVPGVGDVPVDRALEMHTPDPTRPTVGLCFYRSHRLTGNTSFVDELCAQIEAAGANALAVWSYTLRRDSDGHVPALALLDGHVDSLVVTMLATGGSGAADAAADNGEGVGEQWQEWDATALAALDVPVIQAICATASRAAWLESESGLSPLDAATQVAIPEFDGRIVGGVISFKERDSNGSPVGVAVPRYVPDAERCARVAALAVRSARLRHTPAAERRVAMLLTSFPTKHAKVGMAVGLDTPASALALLDALRADGMHIAPPRDPRLDAGHDACEPADARPFAHGDELMHALIAGGGHDPEFLTDEQLAESPLRLPIADYVEWYSTLPETLRDGIEERWGPPPGDRYIDGEDFVIAGLELGNVLVAIQPPRGYGEDPVGIYHDPELPPTHHYLACYRWLDAVWGADAIVHLGKHGTLEWLPGKMLALSPACAPDAALGDIPLVYPFVVNDPGEGVQAKRRAHAVIVDHLVPPMMRADTYDELAELEALLDEYARLELLDPPKLPALAARIWSAIERANLQADLDVHERPDDLSELVNHIDGYLCEVKDIQIKDGLHVLGQAPAGEQLRGLTAAMLRLGSGDVPGLRRAVGFAFGVDEGALAGSLGAAVAAPKDLLSLFGRPVHQRSLAERTPTTEGSPSTEGLRPTEEAPAEWAPPAEGAPPAERMPLAGGAPTSGGDVIDLLESGQMALLDALAASDWDPGSAESVCAEVLGRRDAGVERALRFAAAEVVPRIRRTGEEIEHVVAALNGRHVPSGPSGSPTRGRLDVLPTGRNFYSVDPRSLPSELSWEVGQRLADAMLERHRRETGELPRMVGLVAWGTSAMRTQGDDIAEIFALLGVRPKWHPESRRVTGIEVVALQELGRPRIDVTVRISGFFRDAFPHVIALLDDAVAAVAVLEEPDESNFVAAHARADAERLAAELGADGAWRRATTRVFGSKPGTYGAGLLQLLDGGDSANGAAGPEAGAGWRGAADLAAVYEAWGGYAYGRGLDGAPARESMRDCFARIEAAVKNVDSQEHDILDSDDYYQYHGGMVATVRALSGREPAAYLGDSSDPSRVVSRTLAEETRRVFRARVANPRWIASMIRHGYKGAAELSATVDYLFGYDATANVAEDWMYEQIAERYLLDADVAAFMSRSNPWAARAIAERLLEAADRGMWSAPDDTLTQIRDRYLALEGELEEAGA